MKKLLYVAILAVLLISCSPVTYPFVQIGKLHSNNVEMKDNGKFEYKRSDLTITYDFWNYGGNVSFVITNNSDKDIYLLMDNCFFIMNGVAYDYYKDRTYIIQESISSSEMLAASSSASANVQMQGQLNDMAKHFLNKPALGPGITYTGAASTGLGVSNSATSAISNSKQVGHSIEAKECKTVCIPAHSSKYFSDFNISSTPYRQCGFARDSDSKEGEKLVFSDATMSPYYFENRLVLNINGEIVPVVNKFYVSEYINIHDGENYAYISDYSKDCNGNIRNSTSMFNTHIYGNKDVRYYKHASSNCFYTTYKCTIGVDNDRINANKTQQTSNVNIEPLSSNNKAGDIVMYNGAKCVVLSTNGSKYTLAANEYAKTSWTAAIEHCHTFGKDCRLPSKEELYQLAKLNVINSADGFWLNSESTESKVYACYPANSFMFKVSKDKEFYAIPIISVDINAI